MNDVRKKIESLTNKLQKQTQLPLWALANEPLIYAVALNEKLLWGGKTKLVLKIMKIANRLFLADFFIFIVGLFQVISLYKQANSQPQKNNYHETNFTRIFAGFASSSETHLLEKYRGEIEQPTLKINWVTQEGIANLGRLNLSKIFVMLFKNVWGYSKQCTYSLSEIKKYQNEFLTVCALNSGSYTFYQFCWILAKRKKVSEIAFIAPSMAAFAAIDLNLVTRFLQHGLVAQSILIPEFSIIETLTKEEGHYFKKLYPNIELLNTWNNINPISPLQPVAIILSPNIFNLAFNESIETMLEFAQWAKKLGIAIVLRPTIHVSESERLNLNVQFPGAILDDPTRPLHLSYEYWKPKLVFSGRSTGLATALQYNCLPISYFNPNLNNKTWDMVYPMRQRAFFWPRDMRTIQESILNETTYAIQIKNLREKINPDQ